MGIVKENKVIVKDANGNAITSATHVANINPFRYRSYFYDTEITDDGAVDTFIEYFMAHSFSGDIFKTKNLLYSLAIRYLGYKFLFLLNLTSYI